LLSACDPWSSPRQRILGKWEADNGLSVQFQENGAMLLNYPSTSLFGRRQDTGKWAMNANNEIRFTPEGSGRAGYCRVIFVEDDCILVTGSDGTRLRMRHLDH
jgi:hypothetical protein